MTTEEEMVLDALHNSFVTQAISLITELPRTDVSKAIVEIKAMTAVGVATMEVIPPKSAKEIADVMERNLNQNRQSGGRVIIQLTYGEHIEIGWAGTNHDQLLLRTYTDDPHSETTVQIAASYDGNKHNEVPELIRVLQKFQDQDPTTPGR